MSTGKISQYGTDARTARRHVNPFRLRNGTTSAALAADVVPAGLLNV